MSYLYVAFTFYMTMNLRGYRSRKPFHSHIARVLYVNCLNTEFWAAFYILLVALAHSLTVLSSVSLELVEDDLICVTISCNRLVPRHTNCLNTGFCVSNSFLKKNMVFSFFHLKIYILDLCVSSVRDMFILY